MDVRELHELGNEMLGLIRTRVNEVNWTSASSHLNHGEEEEFADLLLAMLADGTAVLTGDEFDKLSRLVAAFPVAEYDRDLYRYLTDPQVLERVAVVDRP